MSATVADTPVQDPPARVGRDIDDWRPEDPKFWAEIGAKVARRNPRHSLPLFIVGLMLLFVLSGIGNGRRRLEVV